MGAQVEENLDAAVNAVLNDATHDPDASHADSISSQIELDNDPLDGNGVNAGHANTNAAVSFDEGNNSNTINQEANGVGGDVTPGNQEPDGNNTGPGLETPHSRGWWWWNNRGTNTNPAGTPKITDPAINS